GAKGLSYLIDIRVRGLDRGLYDKSSCDNERYGRLVQARRGDCDECEVLEVSKSSGSNDVPALIRLLDEDATLLSPLTEFDLPLAEGTGMADSSSSKQLEFLTALLHSGDIARFVVLVMDLTRTLTESVEIRMECLP
ncbi:MAG: hypothetical protein ACREBR_03795, partial [bacterium]